MQFMDWASTHLHTGFAARMRAQAHDAYTDIHPYILLHLLQKLLDGRTNIHTQSHLGYQGLRPGRVHRHPACPPAASGCVAAPPRPAADLHPHHSGAHQAQPKKAWEWVQTETEPAHKPAAAAAAAVAAAATNDAQPPLHTPSVSLHPSATPGSWAGHSACTPEWYTQRTVRQWMWEGVAARALSALIWGGRLCPSASRGVRISWVGR
eukprot:1157723-Pelagomonas_calceolata.AAC.3